MSGVVEYLGDKHPEELGLKTLRESQRSVLPATVGQIYTVPHMHGGYDYGAFLGPRPLTLECAFMERNAFQLQLRASALATHLIDSDGRPVLYSLQPDRQYMVRLDCQLPIDRMVGLGKFSLPMVAYDPFAYSIYESDDIDVDSPVLVDTDLSVDAVYDFVVTGPATLAIDNFGALKVKPVIEISGSFSSLSLTVGGVVTTYSAAMSGPLVLDFQRGTASIGSTNVFLTPMHGLGCCSRGYLLLRSGAFLNFNMSVKIKAKYAGGL